MPLTQILISAGEASGDMYAARLATAFQARADVHLFGMGGPRMREAGVELVADCAEVSLVGIVEIAKKLPALNRVWKRLLGESQQRKPRFAILTDFPGFHLRLARALKGQGVQNIYFVCPQFWAWRPWRAPAIRAWAVHFPVRTGLVSRTRRAGGFYRTSFGGQCRGEKIACGVCGFIRTGCGQTNRRPVAREPRGRNRAPHATSGAILPSNRPGSSGGAVCPGAGAWDEQVANYPLFAARGPHTSGRRRNLRRTGRGGRSHCLERNGDGRGGVDEHADDCGLPACSRHGRDRSMAGAHTSVPERVANEVTRLLDSEEARSEMRQGLANVREKLGPPGAIERAADIIAGMLAIPAAKR